MASTNRAAGRNVHIYDSKDPNTVLGGLLVTNGITNANFYSMVDIICIFDFDDFQRDFHLRDGGGNVVQRDDSPLQPRNYFIHTSGSFQVTDERCLPRSISRNSTGTRLASFREAVRLRDQRCFVTGEPVQKLELNNWRGFEAAHIFPPAREEEWTRNNYGHWIDPAFKPASGSSINSVQNGMLLRADLHQLFDGYDFSINPDDNYKIVSFIRDWKGIAGKHIAQELLAIPSRPVDQLLRWHFRQAVLANMKGVGEPNFEHDFPPGSDIVGDIIKGPMAAERMESELFSRLWAYQQVE